MTDCSHVEWGVRFPDGHVVPAASEAGAVLMARHEAAAAKTSSGCVVVSRYVVTRPWHVTERQGVGLTDVARGRELVR